MNRIATALVAISLIAVATPSFAKHHEEAAKVEAKADAKADAAKDAAKADAKAAAPAKAKHKARGKKRMHQANASDYRDSRHTYPGSSYSYANRHENGVAIGSAVAKH